ncbi:MAG: hypothetical protein ABSF14_20275 [Terriglobia bacterium]|jgi:hypothetical protein
MTKATKQDTINALRDEIIQLVCERDAYLEAWHHACKTAGATRLKLSKLSKPRKRRTAKP